MCVWIDRTLIGALKRALIAGTYMMLLLLLPRNGAFAKFKEL